MVLLLASLFAAGCGTSVPPSDGEMIRLFRTHEAAFNHVYEIISEKTEGSHYYPPSEFDSIFIRALAAAEGLSCGLQGLYGGFLVFARVVPSGPGAARFFAGGDRLRARPLL